MVVFDPKYVSCILDDRRTEMLPYHDNRQLIKDQLLSQTSGRVTLNNLSIQLMHGDLFDVSCYYEVI
jgi:hypothetical protein